MYIRKDCIYMNVYNKGWMYIRNDECADKWNTKKDAGYIPVWVTVQNTMKLMIV